MDARAVDELARETGSWRQHRAVRLAAQGFFVLLGAGCTVLGVLDLVDGELAGGLVLVGIGVWILVDLLRDRWRSTARADVGRSSPREQIREYWKSVVFFGVGGLASLVAGLVMAFTGTGPWLAFIGGALLAIALTVTYLREAHRYRQLESRLRPGEELIAIAQGQHRRETESNPSLAVLAATNQRMLVDVRSEGIHEIPYEAVERFELESGEKRSRVLTVRGAGQDISLERIPRDRLLRFVKVVSPRLEP